MGERKENRVKMILPAHLTGKDSEGKPYSLLVHTLDFSRLGARLGGIRQPLRVGETVTLEYKRSRAQFAIRWVGMPGTRSEQQVGVESLEPGIYLWLDVPDQKYTDDVDESRRRTNINIKNPVPGASTESPPKNTGAASAATLISALEEAIGKLAKLVHRCESDEQRAVLLQARSALQSAARQLR